MGKFKPYTMDQGELIPMYLGEWIAEDHLARLVHEIVDQLNLSELTIKYTDRGEEAYHPRLLLKLLFYGYATGVFTSRKIHQAIEENIPFRWLAGGQKPDHRTISDFRKNHLDILPGLFRQIIQIARELGYTSLGHVSIDGSKIKANASKHKAMSRDRMKKEIKRLESEIADTLEKAQEQDETDDEQKETTHQGIQGRRQRLNTIKTALQQLEERKPETTSQTPDKDQANFTDDDSRIMKTNNQGIIQGYNPQIAVDSDHGFIVGLQTSNNASDQGQFDGVLSSIQEHTSELPEKVTADAGYFSSANIQKAEACQVDPYIAATKEGKQSKNPYDKTNFTYDPAKETYICPVGNEMELKQTQHVDDEQKPTKWIYECQACPTCPFQNECVKAKSGKRTITRTEADPIREAMRTKVQSDEGKAIYKQRKSIVEPVFGQMKECQGFRQFHLRGKEKAEGEFLLLAISYDLRKLHSIQHPKKSNVYKREKCVQNQKKAA